MSERLVVKLVRTELRLRRAFRIAHGRSDTRTSLVLCVRLGDYIGMGEAPRR